MHMGALVDVKKVLCFNVESNLNPKKKKKNRDYIEPQVPYIPMRTMCGLMGVAVVPIAFYTVRNSGHSLHAAILAALLVLFGKGSARRLFYITVSAPYMKGSTH